MAEKTQLVRIKFPVDTSELKGATVAAQQAQKATDDLRASTAKLGTDSASSFKITQTSIDSMRRRLAELKVTMEALPLTATQRLTKYSNEYKALDAEIKKVTRSLYEQEKASKAVGNSTQNNIKLFGQLGSILVTVFSAAFIKETVSVSLELAKLAGNVEGVERAFKRAFPGSQLILENLRESTHGTISDFELMQRTLQATNLGVSVEHLGTLFEFAATRAQQTGESVDYLVDSVVRGIGRKSILVLDNLGLSATRLKEQFNGASLASQSVADVTEGVAAIAKVELEKMGGYAETAATDVAQITAEYQKLKQAVADRATAQGTLDFYKFVIEATRIAILSEDQYRAELARTDALRNVTAFKNRELTDEIVKDQQKAFDIVQQEINSTLQLIGRNNDRLKDVFKTIETGSLAETNLANKQKKYYEDQNLRYAATILLLKDILRVYTEIDKEVVDSLGLIAAKEAEIESVGDKLKAAKSTTEIHNLNLELAKLNGELADLKAFGTTKQFLEVGGVMKLVPVIAPKNSSKTLTETPKAEMTDQLEADIKELIARIPKGSLTIKMPVQITPESEWDKFLDQVELRQQEIGETFLDNAANLYVAQFDMEVQSVNERIKLLRDFYDEQKLLAGDNEKYKDQLRLKEERELQKLNRQRADREKQAALASILVNTAVGIIKAIAAYDYVGAALAGVEGATQYAIASSARYYAKGKVNIDGPGTGTSDSIPAMLSKGESVIPADKTQRSLKLLDNIHTGKIDDRILDKLHLGNNSVKVMPADNSDIVRAVKSLEQPDVFLIAGVAYQAIKGEDGFSKRLLRKRVTNGR